MSISVVIPCASPNQLAEKYLNRCLASVLWQLEDRDEVIIEGWQPPAVGMGDPRIRVFPALPNKGVSVSRNRAIEVCQNEWVKFLDVDDVLAPFALSSFRKLIIPENIVAVTGPQIKVVNGRVELMCGVPQWQNLKHGNPTLPSMTWVRKAALLDVGGFDERIHFEEDWDLWLRLERQFKMNAFATVRFPVCYYWIDEEERKNKTVDHTITVHGETMDVREYFKRKYGCDPK